MAFANSLQKTLSGYTQPRPGGSGGGGIADLLRNNPSAGGGLGASNSDIKVWMGGRNTRVVGGHPTQRRLVQGGRKEIGGDAALNAPWNWSKAKQQREFKRASLATGQPINSIISFLPVWKQAVDLAAQSLKAGSPMTPYDIMDLMKRDGGLGGTGYTGPRSVTTTSKSVDKISEGTAWAVINDAVTKAIGRAPSDSELKRFIGRANDIAVRNPTRTTTTTKYNKYGQAVSSNSRSRQGASAGDYELAARNLAATPESAAYQAATTYYNAFAQALSSPVSL